MNTPEKHPKKWGAWVLFLSLPTLVCCAIPIILVSLGMGSVVATIYVEKLPFLQWFAHHKLTMFSVTTSILIFSYWLIFRQSRSCPANPELAALCAKAHYWNVRLLIAATVIWAIAVFSTFGLIHFI